MSLASKHWPRDEIFDGLRTALQEYVALHILFGQTAVTIEKRYRSRAVKKKRWLKALQILLDKHRKITTILEQLIEEELNE
jgi:hypothetical protein